MGPSCCGLVAVKVGPVVKIPEFLSLAMGTSLAFEDLVAIGSGNRLP